MIFLHLCICTLFVKNCVIKTQQKIEFYQGEDVWSPTVVVHYGNGCLVFHPCAACTQRRSTG